MCGIAGIILSEKAAARNSFDLKTIIENMTQTLRHRGPDAQGTWFDEESRIAIGHRRLSILDLSELGRQPMVSSNGRYVVVYNGEIYNFNSLKKELEEKGHSFKGSSDTEVLLAATVEWGVRGAVERFVGMFAYCLWDIEDKVLYLVRDRLGIKPLFYGWVGDDSFLFASELKAFHAYTGFDPKIDLKALSIYFRHNYIPAPYSIYKGIYKLIPGSIAKVDFSHFAERKLQQEQYWSAFEVWQRGINDPWADTEDEAIDALEHILIDSVGKRMIADVPLGAFLSGGIDSSTVVALMQAQNTSPVKTFSIGFKEAGYDEAPMARAVAKHLGTDHTELYVTPTEAMDVIPKLPYMWDEPFADSSQIPTFLVSELARRHVTVSLSGDGGDELFSGYSRYFHTLDLWNRREKIPTPVRKAGDFILKKTPQSILDGFYRLFHPLFERIGIKRPLSQVALKVSELLAPDRFEEFYGWCNSHNLPYGPILSSGVDEICPVFFEKGPSLKDEEDMWALMSYLDLVTYLPDDILTKVDRASMAVALEARVPILDHRVVELAARLPGSFKVKGNNGKMILKKILYKYVPERLLDRPKKGFGVPIGTWIRGKLRPWAEELLNEKKIKEQGFLDPQVVSALWKEHVSERGNHKYILWNVLMFQAWLEEWGGR